MVAAQAELDARFSFRVTSVRPPFPELLARHGRILLFRATPADYQALGWWDLAWGMAVTYLIDVLRFRLRPGMQSHSPPILDLVLSGCVMGLTCLPAIALLRPPGCSAWRFMPLINLSFAPTILFLLPIERWVEPEYLYHTWWFLSAEVWAWRVAIVALFFRHGMGLRPIPVLLMTAFPALLTQVIRDSKPGLPLYASYLFAGVYLIHVGMAWWPAKWKRTRAPVAQEPIP